MPQWGQRRGDAGALVGREKCSTKPALRMPVGMATRPTPRRAVTAPRKRPKAVGTDPDAMDILTARGVMDGLLIRGDSTLRAPAEVAAKAEAILANLAELKQAANGDPAILAAGKIFLAQLEGKSVPDGLITAMIRDTRNADVSAIKRLTASRTSPSCRPTRATARPSPRWSAPAAPPNRT